MPSLISWLGQGTLVSTFAATATFIVYTKHCHMQNISPTTDPIFRSRFYARFNPNRNPGLQDVCERKIPLFKVRRELVEDAVQGGGLLVERFCGGVWGGSGALIQRQYLARKYRDETTKNMLWDKDELLESSYPEGTDILNHFSVLEKTPTSILIRCGDSPLNARDSTRPSDGLFEITARADMEKGFAEFTLKSAFYQGEGKAEKWGQGKGFEVAHQLYTKLLMETGIKNCMN